MDQNPQGFDLIMIYVDCFAKKNLGYKLKNIQHQVQGWYENPNDKPGGKRNPRQPKQLSKYKELLQQKGSSE